MQAAGSSSVEELGLVDADDFGVGDARAPADRRSPHVSDGIFIVAVGDDLVIWSSGCRSPA